jgi:hypothetical protein
MNKAIVSPAYPPLILSEDESLGYLKSRLEIIEERRRQGMEAIIRRKEEIFQDVRAQKEILDEIENSQIKLNIVAALTVMGTAVLLGFEAVKRGADLIRWFQSKTENKAIAEKSEQSQGLMEDEFGESLNKTDARDGKIGKRSHPRQWEVCNP